MNGSHGHSHSQGILGGGHGHSHGGAHGHSHIGLCKKEDFELLNRRYKHTGRW